MQEIHNLNTLNHDVRAVTITIKALTEVKDAEICLIVDKTAEQLFEQRKYEIIAQAEEGEKKKIARELHDGIGQQLVLLNLLLQNVPTNEENEASLENIRQLLQSSIQELRELAYNLLPPALDKGFLNALERFAYRVNALGGVVFNLKVNAPITEESFEHVDRFNLYRIVQEVINNALKHAKASEINMILSMEDTNLVVLIQDNGIGFNAREINEGLGLQNIKYRMKITGIRGGITSEPGKGVSVKLILAS